MLSQVFITNIGVSLLASVQLFSKMYFQETHFRLKISLPVNKEKLPGVW